MYPNGAGGAGPSFTGCSAGQGTSLHSCCASESNRRGTSRDHRERLKRTGMVDLLGMFRRRPAKRSKPGFARTRADITALGDSIGGMLTSPVRDAPPIARDAPLLKFNTPSPPPEKLRPRAKTNGAAAAPRVTQRT